MKKLNIVMLVCAVAISALLVVSLAVTSEVRETKKTLSSTFVYSSANTISSQESSTAPASSAASSAKLATYLVKTYNGEIGIFRVGEEKPFRILHVKTDSLPVADQKLLSSGISVQSSEQLQQVVEDYIS